MNALKSAHIGRTSTMNVEARNLPSRRETDKGAFRRDCLASGRSRAIYAIHHGPSGPIGES
jgi:hypothetical protein